jgi:hypothetical protein
MVDKKTIYVRFEKSNYISNKSELLKMQMEILYLRKRLKNLLLIRTKKITYKHSLEEVILSLRKKIIALDVLMPEDQLPKIKDYSKTYAKEDMPDKKIKKIKNLHGVSINKDEIEDELIKIKQKLDLLNNV